MPHSRRWCRGRERLWERSERGREGLEGDGGGAVSLALRPWQPGWWLQRLILAYCALLSPSSGPAVVTFPPAPGSPSRRSTSGAPCGEPGWPFAGWDAVIRGPEAGLTPSRTVPRPIWRSFDVFAVERSPGSPRGHPDVLLRADPHSGWRSSCSPSPSVWCCSR